MSKFRIASNGRRDDETLFMNVLCFGKMAESLNEFLVKGLLVEIQGKLKVDDFEDAEGNQRTSICVMADEIVLGPTATPKGET
jgi:single-strand DNA-binding protein